MLSSDESLRSNPPSAQAGDATLILGRLAVGETAAASGLLPDRAWVAARIEEFADATADGTTRCRVLVRDRDSKFGREFDAALERRQITPVRLPIRSPNLNAHAERLIQTIRVECLDKFVALGTRHLDHLVREFVEHYNEERPHSGIGFGTPSGRQAPLRITGPPGRVRCRTRLGGVLRHYYRAAG